MDIHRLIRMANEIATFFENAEDRNEAVSSTKAHLRNFWEPRMRAQLIEYARRGDGELKDVVREAVLDLDRDRESTPA